MKNLRFSALLFLGLAAALASCGELDTMLSSGKAYKVNALINGRSLDECAILSRGSEIAPYFDFNIKDDPDIASLVIYLKNYMGKETGPRIKYVLPGKEGENAAEGDALYPPPDAVQEGLGAESGDTPEGTNVAEAGAGSTETERGAPDDAVPTEDSGADTEAGSPAPEPEGGQSVENNGQVVENSGQPAASGSDMPEEPPRADTTAEIIITVQNFYDLPSLTFGDDLPFGFYTIVFEVRAANGAVLNSIEKPAFYLASNRLAIEEIVSYLPGVSSAARIVPPGEKIILEAKILAEGVAPYIIWYEGKNIISEGYKADGADRIFWSSPAQTGFQNISVEVFPFNPSQTPGMRGLTHDVSLPVSQRHGRDGYFAPYSNQLSRWYKLWGNLTDTRDPGNTASALIPADDTEIQWQPVSDTYGLKAGPVNVYKIPGSFFKYIRQNEGSGEIRFRFSPYNTSAETLLLKTDLRITDDETGTETVYPMEFSLLEENLVLSVLVQNRQDGALRAQTPLLVDADGFISAAIDFQFFDDNAIISIGVEDTETASITTWEQIAIHGHAEGGGLIQFGGTFDNSYGETHTAAYNFIVTELAVLYNEVSPASRLEGDDENTGDESLESTEITVPETPPL